MNQYMTVAPDGRVDALFDTDAQYGDPLPQHTGLTSLFVDPPFAGGWPKGPTDSSVLHWINGAFAWVETATLDQLKSAKNAEINSARMSANLTSFPYGGKQIACDTLSRSDIDGTNGYVSLFNAFPANWPGAWKATDNTYVPIATVDDWKNFYSAMVAQGQTNFKHSQDLKAQLASATTPEQVAAITW